MYIYDIKVQLNMHQTNLDCLVISPVMWHVWQCFYGVAAVGVRVCHLKAWQGLLTGTPQ